LWAAPKTASVEVRKTTVHDLLAERIEQPPKLDDLIDQQPLASLAASSRRADVGRTDQFIRGMLEATLDCLGQPRAAAAAKPRIAPARAPQPAPNVHRLVPALVFAA